uniref:Serpentine receptor class gamma n=1 Tax=Rhabditophanes sp. KR3021 TaxID=114890 RepID=A0AC35UDJ3_9BILA
MPIVFFYHMYTADVILRYFEAGNYYLVTSSPPSIAMQNNFTMLLVTVPSSVTALIMNIINAFKYNTFKEKKILPVNRIKFYFGFSLIFLVALILVAVHQLIKYYATASGDGNLKGTATVMTHYITALFINITPFFMLFMSKGFRNEFILFYSPLLAKKLKMNSQVIVP